MPKRGEQSRVQIPWQEAVIVQYYFYYGVSKRDLRCIQKRPETPLLPACQIVTDPSYLHTAVCVCVCVCVRVCVFVCVCHTHTHTNTHTRTHKHLELLPFLVVNLDAQITRLILQQTTNLYVYTYECTVLYKYTYACIHMYMHKSRG